MRPLFLALALSITLGSAKAEVPDFKTVVLDPNIGKVCYAVTAADVNHDGKLDAVAISEREAVWYENPGWTKHLMIRDAVPRDHVCIAAQDIDADGQVDFALGAGWPRGGGSMHWITRGESLGDPWRVYPISSEPWTHRMRWADVLGRGRPQLVVSPLNASGGAGIRLLAFPIPADPKSGPWEPVVMDGTLNRAHNHWHVQQPGQPAETIVASQEGITVVRRGEEGFVVRKVAAGARGEKATEKGAGEIKQGSFSGRKLYATIEPMHGNQVVVYLFDNDSDHSPRRVVLEDSFAQGHAVWCADLDGDGRDEVIAAHRERSQAKIPGPGIFIFRAADQQAKQWQRHSLDTSMACEDLWCADFNGDHKVDILAGGRTTHDVKLFLQR
ncbi:MAG: VCBS repeat-containing protein [Pirellulales bacterium]|nr:VCBS repeat-containing protein [Pirellulales bacterium]